MIKVNRGGRKISRTAIIAIVCLLVSQAYSNADNVLSDSILFDALEKGESFVFVDILSVKTEEEHGIKLYLYRANVRKLIIEGDLSANDIKSPIDLFAGASYGNALTIGSSYALFITKDTPYSFSWGFRDNVLEIDINDTQGHRQLETQAMQIYARTQLCKFRKAEDVDSGDLSLIPQDVKDVCARFKSQNENRCAEANAIWKSDIGSHRDESNIFSSRISYLPPKIKISRSQALQLLGEPTIKCGYAYKWFCGGDSRGYAGVLIVIFDSKGIADTLVYEDNRLDYWVQVKKVSAKDFTATSVAASKNH